MKRKILVTGTAGYHLAKKLLDRGDTVIGLDNINDYYDVNLKYARLNELGIDKNEIVKNQLTQSILIINLSMLDLKILIRLINSLKLKTLMQYVILQE